MLFETQRDRVPANRGATVVPLAAARATRCSGCAVRSVALCAGLSDGELAGVGGLGRARLVERGETIVWAGEPNRNCAIVVSGMLKVTASTEDGREQIVGLLYPGDCVGQPYAEVAEHSVTALTPVELCTYTRRSFETMLESHAPMAQRLLRSTLEELNHSRNWMLLLGQRTAQEKLASFLLELARRLTTADGASPLATGEAFELPLTRQQIADVLGLTIETVSRQMTKLKTCRAVQLLGGRGVRILQPDLLSQLAEAA